MRISHAPDHCSRQRMFFYRMGGELTFAAFCTNVRFVGACCVLSLFDFCSRKCLERSNALNRDEATLTLYDGWFAVGS